jgi:chromosome segregation ATPase
MKKAVLSFDEYNKLAEQLADVYGELGKVQDEYDQLNQQIKDLWSDVNAVGGSGTNQAGVQTNSKKQIADLYRQLGAKIAELADAEFNKAKYQEDQARKNAQQAQDTAQDREQNRQDQAQTQGPNQPTANA